MSRSRESFELMRARAMTEAEMARAEAAAANMKAEAARTEAEAASSAVRAVAESEMSLFQRAETDQQSPKVPRDPYTDPKRGWLTQELDEVGAGLDSRCDGFKHQIEREVDGCKHQKSPAELLLEQQKKAHQEILAALHSPK